MENEYLHEMFLSHAREICPHAEVGMTIRIPIPVLTIKTPQGLDFVQGRYIDYLIMPDITISIEDEQTLRVTFI